MVDSIGGSLSVWSIAPFVGMLLSIAVIPLINSHWWEKNMRIISVFWSLAFILPFAWQFGTKTAIYKVLHIIVLDYIPFIILLGSLFVIAGGIIVRGKLKGTPILNSLMIFTGTILASIIGTTGASMLMIRPLINANKTRSKKVHTLIWTIFLMGNIGGALTPVGDPPLFIGFLHGVPFFWTLRLITPFLLNVTILLAIYYCIDYYFYKRENKEQEIEPIEVNKNQQVVIDGLANFWFLSGVLAAIIISGVISNQPLFYDSVNGTVKGITIFTDNSHELVLPWINLLRDAVIALMGYISLRKTSQIIRNDNNFTWNPIKEVGTLFAGIFITIIPAIALLQAQGANLGVTTPGQFFWASGMLSSFLDNTPTYLIFLSLAGQLGAQTGVITDLGIVNPEVLMAISCGSVFMGANTYIGNAPNFMIKTIAEENGIKMPNFFTYMLISVVVLIPLFLLDTWIFFK